MKKSELYLKIEALKSIEEGKVLKKCNTGKEWHKSMGKMEGYCEVLNLIYKKL